MPWYPELFSAPALDRLWEDERRRRLQLVPFFPGLLTGEIDALIGSFAGEPQLHHPVRGRFNGVAAFERFAAETTEWLGDRNAAVEDVDFVLTPACGVEELVLHLDGADGRIELPVAVASDHDESGSIVEQRVYFGTSPLNGEHAIRPPLLQPDPGLEAPGVVGDYHWALAAGDAEAAAAAFESDGYLREPAGGAHVHRGTDELRALFELYFADGGGIELEQCALHDDGRACVVEYNAVAWGQTALPPQAGLAVYVRGDTGKLAAGAHVRRRRPASDRSSPGRRPDAPLELRLGSNPVRMRRSQEPEESPPRAPPRISGQPPRYGRGLGQPRDHSGTKQPRPFATEPTVFGGNADSAG